MSWGTSWDTDMYLSRERFEHEFELDAKIAETKEYIQQTRTKILMAMMGGKDSFNLSNCEGNPCEPIDVIQLQGNEMLDWLIELNDRLFMYESLKNNFDKRENT